MSVVGREGEDVAGDEATSRRAAAEAIAYAPDIELLEIERAALGIETCGSDLACVAARIRQADADLGLIIVANRTTTPVLITARTVLAGRRAVLKSALKEAAPDAIALATGAIAAELVEASGHALAGRVAITASPRDATATLSSTTGAAIHRRSDGTILAAPGRYRLEVVRDGYGPASRAIELRRGATTGVAVALEENGTILGAWWLWLGVGAAAAAAAASSILLLRHSEKPHTEIDQCPRGC